ncbi:MAG: hypothetical protein ACTSWA_05660 [Candidatus Thorarchaeota archaeon]
MSSEKVHVDLECWGVDCNYVHDYVRQTNGNYVCTLPGRYSKTAIRLRISRKKEKGQEIQVLIQEIKDCPKCARKLWILEVPPPSSLIFSNTFKDGNVYIPKDMETEEEKGKKTGTQKTRSTKPVERFLDIDSPPTDAYRDLVNEINFCFANQACAATIVLTRKLVENLIVDILRKNYGMAGLDLFFEKGKHRFRGLSELIANLRSNVADFDTFGLKKRHITTMEKLREEANANAHSILDHASKPELIDLRASARKAVKSLLSVRTALF